MFVEIKSGVKDKRDIKDMSEDSTTICWRLLLCLLCPFGLLKFVTFYLSSRATSNSARRWSIIILSIMVLTTMSISESSE